MPPKVGWKIEKSTIGLAAVPPGMLATEFSHSLGH